MQTTVFFFRSPLVHLQHAQAEQQHVIWQLEKVQPWRSAHVDWQNVGVSAAGAHGEVQWGMPQERRRSRGEAAAAAAAAAVQAGAGRVRAPPRTKVVPKRTWELVQSQLPVVQCRRGRLAQHRGWAMDRQVQDCSCCSAGCSAPCWRAQVL